MIVLDWIGPWNVYDMMPRPRPVVNAGDVATNTAKAMKTLSAGMLSRDAWVALCEDVLYQLNYKALPETKSYTVGCPGGATNNFSDILLARVNCVQSRYVRITSVH